MAAAAFVGCGACGAVAGWCALNRLAALGGLAGAVAGALLVVVPPPPPPPSRDWLDVDGDPGGTARRVAVLWARACAAAVPHLCGKVS